MATSGSVDYSATRDNVIQEALENLRVMAAGDTTSSASFTDHSAMMARRLNNIVKQFSNPADGSPAMHAYRLKRAYLFLQKGEAVYSLGPTTTATGATNKWASAYVASEISADEASGQTVITINDTGTVATGNRIGVELDTGYMQWTTVNGSPTDNGSTLDVTLSAALTANAAAGNRVFVYATTAQGRRPLSVRSAYVRDVNGADRPLDPMLVDGYESVSYKLAAGAPAQYYYENTLLDGTFYLGAASDTVRDVIRIMYRTVAEDLDAAGDELDFEQVWFRALSWALTVDAYVVFPFGDIQYMKSMRDEALAIARNSVPEVSDEYFQPGESG